MPPWRGRGRRFWALLKGTLDLLILKTLALGGIEQVKEPAAALALAAALACWIPARRAMGTSPTEALRAE